MITARGAIQCAVSLLIAGLMGLGLLLTLRPPPATMAFSPLKQTGGETTVATSTITIPAYDILTQPQYNPTYNMYYEKTVGDSGSVTHNRALTMLTLENNYLRLTILPELGGRIYQVIDKTTGHNIFYQNPVLKPSPWGPPEMNGGWLAAGGLEWCLPVEEHGYEWGIPWLYQITDTPDGMQVSVRDTDAVDRLRARIDITLPDNAAYFQVTPVIENPTAFPIDFQFWLNGMLAPGPTNSPSANLHIIMPTDQVTLHSSGDSRLPGEWAAVDWPVYNGVDWSVLGNWHEWYGFFQRPQAAGDFQAVYDTGYDEGVVRTYDSQMAWGAKFFAFGWHNAIDPNLYTNDGSAYVEIHGGAGATFHSDDQRRLEAGQTLTWAERWYPVAGLGDLTWANAEIALHATQAAGQTYLHLAPTRPLTDVRVALVRRRDSAILFDDTVEALTPGAAWHSPPIATAGLTTAELGVVVFSGDVQLAAWHVDGVLAPPPTLTMTPSSPLFLFDDASAAVTSRTVRLSTGSSDPLTWTATISPAVTWLAVDPPSGPVAGTAPATLTVTATRPLTYGAYSTALSITATGAVNPISTTFQLAYVPKLAKVYLPVIFKL